MKDPLCSSVIETGLHVAPDYPTCVDESRRKRENRCFWRRFHQLKDDVYRKKGIPAQKELFT